jgi:hypothetical protein
MPRPRSQNPVPQLLFEKIAPVVDPLTLGLDPDEVTGRQRRLRHNAIALVQAQLEVSISGLLDAAALEVPEFSFLGHDHDVLQCAFIHLQQHGCGSTPPTSLACANVRAIVDLVASSEFRRMGGAAEAVVESGDVQESVDALIATLISKFRPENEKRTFPRSRDVCNDAENLYNGAAEFASQLRMFRLRWLVGPSDALDSSNRPALSRAEAAFWALHAEPSDTRDTINVIRRRIQDLRGSSKRPDNNVLGRRNPDRPILLIKERV